MNKTTIQVLAFGIARDIIGTSSLDLEVCEGLSVAELRQYIQQTYPQLAQLRSLAIAVNSTYASDEQWIYPGDDVALIPPVSGG